MKKGIFVSINAILILLIPIYIVFINFPYGFIPSFCNIVILFIFDYKIWSIYISKFPLNDLKEYSFNPRKDFLIEKEKDNYYIELYREGNIYYCKINDGKKLLFNMKGCMSPISYIKAYLIRQFYFVIINNNKLKTSVVAKNIYIYPEFEYFNIILKYQNKNIYLVKKYKTKSSLLMKEINLIPMGNPVVPPRCKRPNTYAHCKVSENDYVKNKVFKLFQIPKVKKKYRK